MSAVYLLAFLGMVVGCCTILGINLNSFTEDFVEPLTRDTQTMRSIIDRANHQEKVGFLRRELREVHTILTITGRADRFSGLCALSLVLFCAGACAALLLNNLMLVPVLAGGCFLLPLFYVRLTANDYKKALAAELETALSVVTTAYMRTENIQLAVEENLEYLGHPVQEVFRYFLTRVQHIDPDLEAALREIQSAISNEVWVEWCEAMGSCQTDRSLKSTLPPIVSKLSDMRIVNSELEQMVSAPRKEFITMAALVVLNIPLVGFINKDWFAALTNTIPGKTVIALCIGAIFVCLAFVVRLTQPIEYRR